MPLKRSQVKKTQPMLSINHYMATPDDGDLAPKPHPLRDTDELLELVQDKVVWRELVVEWSDLQPPD